ncbi:MAG: hypothetical protein V4556_01160 [Bacteroidota bacterium]
MNKRIILVCTLVLLISATYAQDNDSTYTEKGFKKEKLFTGGNVALSFGSGRTAIGVSPHFGYSLTKWLDAAVSLNYNYISQRFYDSEDKYRYSTIGPGAFVRIFPVKFLFAQIQYEHNFIKRKYIPSSGSSQTQNYGANSLLIGAGYASNRSSDNNTYYYLSIGFDVLKEPYSPYKDNFGRAEPVIRAGYNIALFQGRKNR